MFGENAYNVLFLEILTLSLNSGRASFGAYVPDLPGCIAAAETKEEVLELIQEAIEFHLEGIKEEGAPVPQPHSYSEFVEVHA